MIGLPPGNILQYLFLKERLNRYRGIGKKSFIEIGSGNGNVSEIFLKKGFEGIGFDLNESACANNRKHNQSFIDSGKYAVNNENFITSNQFLKADIVISCMVIEHMPEELLDQYFKKCHEVLNDGGIIISLVPSSMKHWGIEDEIAGHIKRYEFHDFNLMATKYHLQVKRLTGLTYPLSNVVFGISNSLVKKNESDKLKLSQQEKTVYTGNRDVQYKTTFPKVFNLILNPIAMYPFHVLQKMFGKNKNNLVIYGELEKR